MVLCIMKNIKLLLSSLLNLSYKKHNNLLVYICGTLHKSMITNILEKLSITNYYYSNMYDLCKIKC